MMFVLTFLPLYFLLFVYFSIKGVFSVFGKMKPTPILFHAILADKRQAFMKQRFMLRFIPWILLWLGTSALATSYMPKIFHTISLRLDVEYWVFNLAGFAFFDLVLVLLINKEVGLKNLLSDRKKYTKWFAVNYAEPNVLEMSSVLKTSPERRNLVILQLESMESGFSSAELFEENLLSPLQKWMARGVSFSNYVKCPGGYFTIDGLSAQLLGVPVLMDRIGIDLHGKVRKIKTRGVLSKAISVINVLSEAGWKTTALTGASGNYTQKESFFLSHGFQEVLCKEYWDARLTEVERRENQNKEWGYSDHFLYSELKRILNATQSDQPFAVLLETADTHPPIGSVSENARRFGDVRDAFLCASHQAAEFLDWASTQTWFANTVFVIIGDHPWQDWEQAQFTKLTKKLQSREIFNLIINPCVKRRAGIYEVPGGWSPMDWAPTLCEAMGIEIVSKLNEKKN